MARITQDDFSGQTDANNANKIEIDATGQDTIEVPNSQFIADSNISRDGQDLVLETSDGQALVVQNYFNADNSPLIESADGSILTENLVNSFLKSDPQFAQHSSLNDESPVGAVEEISGNATVLRVDGTSEPLTLGTPIYQGDTIETSETGAVNVMFIDETSMAVSENARLSVDEYQFDPSTESGTTNLSVLRGVFVFTSGLIGRDDPDDVLIDTPVGSIGIRGTIIAGNINPGGESEITVVEGAIVVTNGAMEVTLSQQYESVRLGGFNNNMQDVGVQSAADVGKTYGSVQDVVPKLFSSINDNIEQDQSKTEVPDQEEVEEVLDAQEEVPEAEELQEEMTPEPINDQLMDTEFNSDVGALPHEMGEHKNRSKEDNRFNEHRNPKSLRGLGDDQINPELLNNPHGPHHLPIFAEGHAITAGISLSPTNNIGDVNNDGYADSAEGTPNAESGGEVHIVDGYTSTSTITGTGSTGDNLGHAVSGIGDFDGDGKSDYAFSVLNSDTGGTDRGKIIFKFGDGTDHFIAGSSNGMKLGAHIDGLGDIDGDGLSDVIVTAEGVNDEAYIIKGTTGTPTITTMISTTYEIVAGGAAGDLNGDGFDDIAISLKMGDDVNTFVIFGQGSLPSTIDMAYLENSDNALKIHHAGAGQHVGTGTGGEYQVTAVGDRFGDGFDDIQVGVIGNPQFIVHGALGGNAGYVTDGAVNDGHAEAGKISATADDQSLVGDVHFIDNTHTGLSMKGGDGRNDFSLTNTNFINIDGGAGVEDTIRYGVNGGTLDFSNVNFEQISQVERIHFSQDTATIKLTAENIFNLLKTSDDGSLTIELGTSGGTPATAGNLQIDDLNGVTGATIHDQIIATLNEEGSGTATHTVDGGYDHYQIGGYNLYIDTDVTTTVV